MKGYLVLLLAALLLLNLATCPAEAEGREILLVIRYVGSWEYSDDAVVLLSSGERLHFDLRGLPQEVLGDRQNLLAFLRHHGTSSDPGLYPVPQPDSLEPLGEDFALRVRGLLDVIRDTPFETRFHAFDAGGFDLYGVIQVDGEARLTLISESGTFVGQSPDPAAQALIELVGPRLLLD